MYNLLLLFKILFSIHPKNEHPELYKNGGKSAMLQIFPRGRSAMKGRRSSGGRSAMLENFRAEGLQGGWSAIQHRH